MSNEMKDNSDATPDALMEKFKGRGLKQVLVFTVVVHVVVILGSSVPFFVRTALAGDRAKLSEQERIKVAVEDASAALTRIAKKHGLNPQDISSQFGGSGSRTSKSGDAVERAPETDTSRTTAPAEDSPDLEKSAYETNLESTAEGPSVPSFEDDGDDIF